MNEALKAELEKLQKLPQRQDSTIEQLRDLLPIANRLGMYDAADYMRQAVDRTDVALKAQSS